MLKHRRDSSMSNLTPQIRNVIDAMGHVYTSYDFGHVLVPFQVSTMHLKHYLCFEICPFFFFSVLGQQTSAWIPLRLVYLLTQLQAPTHITLVAER